MVAGKYPHLATIVPGGITYQPSIGRLEELLFKYLSILPWVKKMIYVTEDLIKFMEDIGYTGVGERRANLICYGVGDDPETYNGRYEDMDDWGLRREVTPGVVIDGDVVTNKLTDIHLGINEYVSHSFYDEWDGGEVSEDPLGNSVSPKHPWNKKTRPKPSSMKWGEKYSWVTSPRWVYRGRKYVVEAGPIARMWVTAASGKVDESTGSSLRFTLPKTNIPGINPGLNDEVELEWRIPGKVDVLERLRARAYYLAYIAYITYKEILKALKYVKEGKTKVFNPFERPKWSLGVGLTEAARGALGHWVIVKDGKIHRYQVITPSNINASPRDGDGDMGPYEESLLDTPITEESTPDGWDGVDIVRVIRSMDPCLACGVTMYIGDRKVDKIIYAGGGI